jgi:hypothetical protein
MMTITKASKVLKIYLIRFNNLTALIIKSLNINKEYDEEECKEAMNIESSDEENEVSAPKLIKLESKAQAKLYIETQLAKLINAIKKTDFGINSLLVNNRFFSIL